MNKDISVIVPTYNEAENIPDLIEKIFGSLKEFDFEIIVVDDGSPDGTADIADSIGKIDGKVKIIRRTRKMGLSSAVLSGIRFSKADVLAVMDADLQHPPEVLPKMYKKIKEGNTLVLGSRYIKGGGVQGWGLPREMVSKAATEIAHLLLPGTRKISDPMTGFFMFRRSSVKDFRINGIGFKILLELLIKVKWRSISEVPYIFKARKKGRSKLSSNEILNYMILLLKLRSGL